jgi:hypothetical protein
VGPTINIIVLPIKPENYPTTSRPKNFMALCMDHIPMVFNMWGSVRLEQMPATYGETKEEAMMAMLEAVREHLKRMNAVLYTKEV